MKTVIFKPTYRCNLKCTYCYEAKNRDAEHPLEMTQKQAITAINNIIQVDPKDRWNIIWHGGEPSIVGLDFIRNVINHFEDVYNIDWAFQSNGTLLTDDWLEFFKEKEIAVGSSWDGLDNNVTRTSRNFLDLVQRAHKIGAVVNAIHTMTPSNTEHIVESYQFAQDNGFRIIYNTAFGINLSIEEHQFLAKRMGELFNYLCISEDSHLERPFDEIISYLKGEHLFFCEGINCVGSWFGIHPDGGIYACGKPWSEETCMGNVFTDDPKTLKEKLDNSEFRQILREARQQQLEDCKSCKYVMTCRGKCPFTGFTGTVYSKDYGQCAYNKTFYDECLKILKQHLINQTLTNIELIDAINNCRKMEFSE